MQESILVKHETRGCQGMLCSKLLLGLKAREKSIGARSERNLVGIVWWANGTYPAALVSFFFAFHMRHLERP